MAANLPEIESVAHFIERLGSLKKRGDGEVYVYRGERDIDWKLVPRLLRKGNEKLLANERDAVRELIAVKPLDFSDDMSMFDRLVRMQHFGLPTRLLDVTAHPLVALYNATEESDPPKDGRVYFFIVKRERKKYFDSDTVSCIANLANLSDSEKSSIFKSALATKHGFNKTVAVDRLLQFVRAEKPYFRSKIVAADLFSLWFVVPKLSNARIIAQRGAFIIWGFPTRPDGLGIDSERIAVGHFVIPAAKKVPIRTDLDNLGINAAGLFPEIESAAAHIVKQLS